MAIRRRRAQSSNRQRGEKHGWLRFDRYEIKHQEVLAAHPFVVADHTQFTRLGGNRILCEGRVVCHDNVEIKVEKLLAVRTHSGQVQVRGFKYNYHARALDGRFGRNVLRYDSGHTHTPGVYHRHEYDLETGEDRLTTLGREEFPVLSEMVDELAAMFPDAK